MSEVSDAEIAKFLAEKYPQVKNNIKFGRMLYDKAMNKNAVIRSMGTPFEIQIKEIRGLTAKSKVAFKGIVAEVQKDSYKGCPECRKKICKDHDKTPVDIVITRMLIGDDSDMIWVSAFGLSDDVKDGMEVTVVGSVKEWNGERSVGAFEVKPVAVVASKPVEVKPSVAKGSVEEKTKQIVDFVESSQRVALNVFKSMVDGNGLNYDDVAKLVTVDVKHGVVYPFIDGNYGEH